MEKIVDKYAEGIPLRQAIADHIIHKIKVGLYQHNAKLSSINNLSEQIGVSRDTVEKAYRKLQSLGYIRSVHGKGHYVTKKSKPKLKVIILLSDLNHQKVKVCRDLMLRISTFAQAEIRLYFDNIRLLAEHFPQDFSPSHHYVLWSTATAIQDDHIKEIIAKIPAAQFTLLTETISPAEASDLLNCISEQLCLA